MGSNLKVGGWGGQRSELIDLQEQGGGFKERAEPAITSIAFSNLPLAADSLIRSH
jgi:hypothetical protein